MINGVTVLHLSLYRLTVPLLADQEEESLYGKDISLAHYTLFQVCFMYFIFNSEFNSGNINQ